MLALRLGLRLIGLVSTMILARLLTPEDFGVVAIAMSFFALLHLIKNFGFDTVIIQMPDPQKQHYDTAWTFNFIFGVLLAGLFIALSGVIARFYEVPDLQYLIWAVASLFIIGGLGNVGTLDFRKQLVFSKEFKVNMLPKIIGTPVTLLLAYYLRSYWALTIGTIVTQLAGVIVGYRMHPYRPNLSFAAARELFNFSKWLMFNNLLYFLNQRSPELLIGKILNPQAAGIFTVSNEVAMMVTTEVSAAVSRASYPGYAKVARDNSQLRSLFLNVIGAQALILFPMAVGCSMTADLVVPMFLGSQWLAAIPLIQIIALGGLLTALNSNIGYIFMALGNPRLSSVLGSIRITIFLTLLVSLLLSEGLVGAAWAFLYTTMTMYVITNIVLLTRLPVTFEDLLRTYYRPILGVAMMALCLWPISVAQSQVMLQQAGQLATMVAVGAVAYGITVLLLWLLAGRPDGFESQCLSRISLLIKRGRR